MMRFEHPAFFQLMWLLPLLALSWVGYRMWRRSAIRKLGLETAVKRQLPAQGRRWFWFSRLALLFVLALLIIAAANPQRGSKKVQASQKSSDVIIAFDISQSMLCADISPSRLVRARIFASQLVKALKTERIGLIFFAGDAVLQMPLSTDYEAALMFLQNAAPDLVSNQGTAIPAAIEVARKTFDPDPGAGRALIIISDGENHEADMTEAAESAYDDGIVIFTIGAGTPEGGPIPMGPGAYKRDSENQMVRTKLDESMLAELARAAHGETFNIRQGDAAISALASAIGQLQKRELSVRSFAEFDSHFQSWLLPAIVLFWGLLWWKPKRHLP